MERKKSYKTLNHEGILCNYKISYWRGKCSATPEDLGIINLDESVFHPGNKRLVDRKHLSGFSAIWVDTYKKLDNLSYSFFDSMTRFVPIRNVEKVEQLLERKEDEFNTLKTSFLSLYSTMKTGWLEKHPEHYKALAPFYPSESCLSSKFNFSYSFFQITPPTLENLKSKEKKEQFERFRDKLRNQQEEFLSLALTDLRNKIQVKCTELIENIQNGVAVRKDSILKLVNTFDDLNFMDDKEVEESLKTLKTSISNIEKVEKDDSVLRQNISEIAQIVINTCQTEPEKVLGRYKRRIQL